MKEYLSSFSKKVFSKACEWYCESLINPSKVNKLKKYAGITLGAFSFPTWLSVINEAKNDAEKAYETIKFEDTSFFDEISDISVSGFLSRSKTFKEITENTRQSLLKKGYSSEEIRALGTDFRNVFYQISC